MWVIILAWAGQGFLGRVKRFPVRMPTMAGGARCITVKLSPIHPSTGPEPRLTMPRPNL